MNDLLCEGQEIIIIGRSGYGGYVREPSRFDHDFVEQCLEFLPKFIHFDLEKTYDIRSFTFT